MFRREFGLMPDLVRAVTPGDTQRAALVAGHIALLSGVDALKTSTTLSGPSLPR